MTLWYGWMLYRRQANKCHVALHCISTTILLSVWFILCGSGTPYLMNIHIPVPESCNSCTRLGLGRDWTSLVPRPRLWVNLAILHLRCTEDLDCLDCHQLFSCDGTILCALKQCNDIDLKCNSNNYCCTYLPMNEKEWQLNYNSSRGKRPLHDRNLKDIK